MAWPLACNLGRRIARRVGWTSSGSHDTQSDTVWRQHLWEEKAVVSLLDGRNMRSTEILDPEHLREFLARSRQVEFNTHDQWSRLLTLEHTLQRLAACRRALRATAA